MGKGEHRAPKKKGISSPMLRDADPSRRRRSLAAARTRALPFSAAAIALAAAACGHANDSIQAIDGSTNAIDPKAQPPILGGAPPPASNIAPADNAPPPATSCASDGGAIDPANNPPALGGKPQMPSSDAGAKNAITPHPQPPRPAGIMPLPRTVPSAATTPHSCDPPYTWDAHGAKHYKPGCL